jgi:hypothetical protein
MKDIFLNYLQSIGLTKTSVERAETIYKFYKEVCPEEITDLFVTDYIKEDGSREYENLWFFSQVYCMEAKLFLIKDDFDISPIGKHIVYSKVEKQDYDYENATEKSRMNLEFAMDTTIRGHMKASRENCNRLKHIISKYIAPNLKK